MDFGRRIRGGFRESPSRKNFGFFPRKPNEKMNVPARCARVRACAGGARPLPPAGVRRADLDPRHRLVSRADRAARALDPAGGAGGDAVPRAVPGDTAIPPEGAIDEAVETAKEFCGARPPGSSTESSRRCCANARPRRAQNPERRSSVGRVRATPREPRQWPHEAAGSRR